MQDRQAGTSEPGTTQPPHSASLDGSARTHRCSRHAADSKDRTLQAACCFKQPVVGAGLLFRLASTLRQPAIARSIFNRSEKRKTATHCPIGLEQRALSCKLATKTKLQSPRLDGQDVARSSDSPDDRSPRFSQRLRQGSRDARDPTARSQPCVRMHVSCNAHRWDDTSVQPIRLRLSTKGYRCT